MKAYLHHGTGSAGPFCTEEVEAKEELLEWQKLGLSFTASGYGKRIPTRYKVKFAGHWRRVFCCQYSNAGTLYIGKLGPGFIKVDILQTSGSEAEA